jgi:hypothetical protein
MKRALVTMLAGASLFWMLFGMLDVSAAAADMTWRGGSASHSAGDDSPGDTDHHCRERWSHESGDRGHCCNPKPGPTPSPTATPRPTAAPTRAPSPTPRPRTRPATVVVPRSHGSPSPSRSPASTSAAEPAAGSRPPVLAPPTLTIPPVASVHPSSPGPGVVSVVALSTILVAGTIAVVSLILVRRSD